MRPLASLRAEAHNSPQDLLRGMLGAWLAPLLAVVPIGAHPSQDHAGVIIGSPKAGPHLRGDWEEPNTVVLVYEPEWAASVATIATAAAKTADVVLLLPSELEQEGLLWLASGAVDEALVHVVTGPLDSPWIRDFGPLQLVDASGGSRFLDTLYDRPDRPNDESLPVRLGKALDLPVQRLPLILDGGALVSDGAGLCAMTTESFDQTGLLEGTHEASELIGALGCRALALVPPLEREETKHADISIQFTAPGKAMVAWIDPEESPTDAERLEETARALRRAALALGRKIQISRIPMPVLGEGRYRTYINSLRVGASLLVPSYDDVPLEREAAILRRIEASVPGLTIIPVPSSPMIELMGAVHCLAIGLKVPDATRFSWAMKSEIIDL